MATFITTMHFTEQGIKAVRDTCERAAAFKAAAKKMGVKVSGMYWTLGAFDGVIVCEAPDEETATAALLHLGSHSQERLELGRHRRLLQVGAYLANQRHAFGQLGGGERRVGGRAERALVEPGHVRRDQLALSPGERVRPAEQYLGKLAQRARCLGPVIQQAGDSGKIII